MPTDDSPGSPTAEPDVNTRPTSTQRHPRLSVKMRVRLSTIDAETDPWTGKTFFRTSEETCANVSQSGAFVVTQETIAPGRRVLLELEIPGGRDVQATARVAWSKTAMAVSSPAGQDQECGIGVEFLGGPRELIELEQFITRSLRRRRIASEANVQYATPHRR